MLTRLEFVKIISKMTKISTREAKVLLDDMINDAIQIRTKEIFDRSLDDDKSIVHKIKGNYIKK